MPSIRLTAAAGALVVLAFALSPATARPCSNDDAGCAESAQPNPMKLDKFIETWKPVAKSKRAKKTKSVRKPAGKKIASEPAVAETAPGPAPMQTIAAKPEPSMETDEVGVTSSNEVEVGITSSIEMDETDGVASQVPVVAFNEVNEVDLAGPVAPAPAETFGQSVSAEQPAADTSWIGKLLLAVGGTIALAGATRFLVA